MRHLAAALALLLAACSSPTPAPRGEPEPKANLGPSAGPAEVGFVDVETVGSKDVGRLFYVYHPAADDDGTKPLIVLGNGGPGFPTSSGLLIDGVGPMRVPPGKTTAEPNAGSFTPFASLLFIDARDAGFSYSLSRGGPQLTTCTNLDDAVDHLRVVLRFLAARPETRARRVVFAAESYAGVRAVSMLHLLRHPESANDPALAAEIDAHRKAIAPVTIEQQFGEMLLIQAYVLGRAQLDAQQPILERMRAEHPGTCPYDVAHDEAWCGQVLSRSLDAFADPATRAQLFPTALASVEKLLPPARLDAYRPFTTAEPHVESSMSSAFGALTAADRYYVPMASCIVTGEDLYPAQWFYELLSTVRVFMTNAKRDAQIHSPTVPALLGTQKKVVMQPDRFTVTLAPGQDVTVRFPAYDAGHSVSLTNAEDLARDVRAWLEER